MHYLRNKTICSIVTTIVLLPFLTKGQTLDITDESHEYGSLTDTEVTLSGHSELHLTNSGDPIPGCTINFLSEDSWLFLHDVLPSFTASSLISKFQVGGKAAVPDSNIRIVQYGQGAVVIPHPAGFQPLEVFDGENFAGESMNLGPYVQYGPGQLGSMASRISSLVLKRGYTATLAQNADGTGLSINYVSADGDLLIGALPNELNGQINFIRIFPWRWVTKKGSCDVSPTDLNAKWHYNWNISLNSPRDWEYVAIKQQPYWPGLNQNWQTRGVNHLSGYNEPNNSVEDAYKNLNPPGSVSDAVARWPELLGTGLRVGAPAVTDGGYSWIVDFINQAEAAGHRIDYVPVHYYRSYPNNDNPQGAANNLYNFLRSIHDVAQRPIWVTEFNNGANWTSDPDPTVDQNRNVIEAMINMMDDTPWIERYSIYSRVEWVRQTHYDQGGLTPMGEMYLAHEAPIAYEQILPGQGKIPSATYYFDGHLNDDSGSGNNALTRNFPEFVPGQNGEAISLDGTEDFVLLPDNLAGSADFTFAAWVYWRGGSSWQRIFDFGAGTQRNMFLTPNASGGGLRFAITTGGSGSEQQLNSNQGTLPQNTWTHVAVTLSGNTGRLYLNGAQVATGTISLNPASLGANRCYLGKSQYKDPLFGGEIDDVIIAEHALTSTQIAALMTNQAPVSVTNNVDGGSGQQGVAYSGSIAGSASDPDGLGITYSKVYGPSWLNVASDGSVSGTPGFDVDGAQHFSMRATDAAGATTYIQLAVDLPIVNNDGTWSVNADGLWSDASKWSGGAVANGAGYTADFSALNISANRTVTLDSSRYIGTLRFGDTSGSQTWTVAPGGGTLTLDSGSSASPSIAVNQNTATIAAALGGANGFTKSGAGTLILNANNPLAGPLYLDRGIDGNNNDGATRIAHPNAIAGVSALSIRNTSVSTTGGAVLQLDGSAGGIVVSQPVSASCKNNDFPTIQNLAGTNTISGNVSLNVGGNRFNIRSDAGLLVMSGQNQYVGSLTGGRSYAFSGVGDHLVSGPILDSVNTAPISLTKTGTGTLTLAAANTYGSTSTVNGGRLLVDGSVAGGSVTVGNTATLGGHGVIGGPTTIQAGGTLSPGTSVGELTINNTLTLSAGSSTYMELDRQAATNDSVRGVTTLNYGGTLIVTNLAGELVAGDSYQLFQTAAHGGAFQTVNLPVLNPGLGWNTNDLPNGTLSVVQVVSTNPTNITHSAIGGQLTLAWPSDHLGWRLETNAVSLGEPSAWFSVPASTATNQVTFEIDPSQTNVFFRLVYP